MKKASSNKKSNKYIKIQLIRIVAMLFIVICHLVQEIENPMLAKLSQFFNVGVYIFLFVSGYLYGNKALENVPKWLLSRFVKLMIPIYIFLAFIFTMQIINNVFELKYLIIYVFNLQRFFGYSLWLEHLWFMTVIWICYLITPLLYQHRDKLKPVFILFYWILCCIISYLDINIGQIMFYIGAYLIGYVYRNIDIKEANVLVIIAEICGIFSIRLLGLYFFDNTILYNNIIVAISHSLLAVLLYLFICKITKTIKVIKYEKLIEHFDGLSFYIYLVHCVFISGPIRLMNITNSIFINIGIVFICIYIYSLLLQKITCQFYERIQN